MNDENGTKAQQAASGLADSVRLVCGAFMGVRRVETKCSDGLCPLAWRMPFAGFSFAAQGKKTGVAWMRPRSFDLYTDV